MPKTMTDAARFFWEHGGYSYNPKTETKAEGRRRTAESMAAAEAWADEHGLTFKWEWDDVGDLGDHDAWCEPACGKGHDVTVCVASYRDGSPAGALGGIIDADANYRRVIEAELALEAREAVYASAREAF